MEQHIIPEGQHHVTGGPQTDPVPCAWCGRDILNHPSAPKVFSHLKQDDMWLLCMHCMDDGSTVVDPSKPTGLNLIAPDRTIRRATR